MDDEKIIDLYLQRSEEAIFETDSKYGKLCMHLARNMLWSFEGAQECVNDTYINVWNSIPPEKPNNLCAFIMKITRNLALKKIEYNTTKKRNSKIVVSLSELNECISGNENIEYQYDAEMLAKCISDFLHNQDLIVRNVFIRRYWFYDSINDISYHFSMSESNIKSMLFRTRNKLKEHLLKEGYLI